MDENIQAYVARFYDPNDREEERMIAEARAKYWSDYNSEMHSQREMGKEEGREEAIAGVAKKMLAQEIDIKMISAITGLPVEEISKFQKV